MKFAVIQTGGKQYIVKPEDKIKIEKLPGEVGESISFDQVLLAVDEDKIDVGKPVLGNVKVEAKILDQARARKVLVMKYKNKTRYRRKYGHRQQYTKVEITKV